MTTINFIGFCIVLYWFLKIISKIIVGGEEE